jgi:hypothetical protein
MLSDAFYLLLCRMSLCLVLLRECRYACNYAVCRNAECHYAECHYAECRGIGSPAFSTNIRLELKYLNEKNILAYLSKSSMMKKKKFYEFVNRRERWHSTHLKVTSS